MNYAGGLAAEPDILNYYLHNYLHGLLFIVFLPSEIIFII